MKLIAIVGTISLLGLAGCTDAPPPLETSAEEYAESTDGDVVYPDVNQGQNSICKTLTVKGSLYYNDLRSNGRFAIRKKTDQVTDGTREVFQSAPVVGDPGRDNKNYLALRDAKVSIYEVDTLSVPGSCPGSDYMGSTQVLQDGTWSWTGTVCDFCRIDGEGANDNGVSVAAKVSLERCDNPAARCFSLRDPNGADSNDHFDDAWDGTVWSRWIRTATLTAPVVVHTATIVDTGMDYFQSSGTQTAAVFTDLSAQAANVFAGLVDVTRKVHLQGDLAFAPTTDDEVKAFYPAVNGYTHSHEDSRLCVAAEGASSFAPRVPTGWAPGSGVAHEYGHLTHYWRWESHGKWTSFCYDSDGDGDDDCDESYAEKEYAVAAFKEGWADFIAHVTFDQTGSSLGCDTIERDDPRGCSLTGLCPTGRHYIGDVSQVLCDLWDSAGETSTHGGAVSSDSRSDSLTLLSNTLAAVWNTATSGDRDDFEDASRHHDFEATAPLGICEFAQRMVDNGQSELSIEAALAQSSLDCSLH